MTKKTRTSSGGASMKAVLDVIIRVAIESFMVVIPALFMVVTLMLGISIITPAMAVDSATAGADAAFYKSFALVMSCFFGCGAIKVAQMARRMMRSLLFERIPPIGGSDE